jgi:ribose transport system permease protein
MIGPLPWLILPMALVLFAVSYLLNRHPIGRYMLAIGGNQSAAELSGISIRRTVIWAHSLSAILAALAGIMLVARLQISTALDWR